MVWDMQSALVNLFVLDTVAVLASGMTDKLMLIPQ
jgi:hypothetical protein